MATDNPISGFRKGALQREPTHAHTKTPLSRSAPKRKRDKLGPTFVEGVRAPFSRVCGLGGGAGGTATHAERLESSALAQNGNLEPKKILYESKFKFTIVHNKSNINIVCSSTIETRLPQHLLQPEYLFVRS